DNERLRQESKEQQERQRQEINTQLSERDGNASELLKVVQEELERQRQDNERLRQDLKEQQEQQRKEISKLTDTISTLAASSQKVREK
ncbi:MAG: hypothetical protein L6R39_005262, partial [Caloplaca ligustica]